MGVHYSRHRGGPGWVEITPGEVVLTGRGRTLRHTSPVLQVERKRFEPPWGNHWIALTDGEVTGHVVVSRRRAEALLAEAERCGFRVEPVS